MNSFALYRMPHDEQCTLIEQTAGEPEPLDSIADLDGCSGFVVAPFVSTNECPLLVIRPDSVSVLAQNAIHFGPKHTPFWPKTHSVLAQNGNSASDNRQAYAADFNCFHSHLLSGEFRKLVLARSADVSLNHQPDPFMLFRQACMLYPRLFIALVYTPQSGLWLTATPEILLDSSDGHNWRTIALAGTMRLSDDDLDGEGQHMSWSTKNIEEQRVVATYIAQCLQRFSNDVAEQGPRTVRAANLVHLRSDFTFTLYNNNARVGELLQQLHPTPAVCGLPKDDALRFITRNEHTARRYYSGFMGPFNMSNHSTHLYVSLRCMQLFADHCTLYAGGGLLRESNEEQEWVETEAKMLTMRNLIITE